jgi:hypothetical protein
LVALVVPREREVAGALAAAALIGATVRGLSTVPVSAVLDDAAEIRGAVRVTALVRATEGCLGRRVFAAVRSRRPRSVARGALPRSSARR